MPATTDLRASADTTCPTQLRLLAWALEQTLPPTMKLVLIGLATGQPPHPDELAVFCGCDHPQAVSALDNLFNQGYIAWRGHHEADGAIGFAVTP